jgi:hypothetical protein
LGSHFSGLYIPFFRNSSVYISKRVADKLQTLISQKKIVFQTCHHDTS